MSQEDARDMQIVKQRFCEYLLSRPIKNVKKDVKSLMDSLRPDGSWGDVDYKDQAPLRWKTGLHLRRLKKMVYAYRTPDNALYNNEELKKKILSALGFWLRNDFRNPNWWWNKIGVPWGIGTVLLLMEKDVSAARMEAGINIMKRCRWKGWTGQNLVWGAINQVIRGCLENSPELVAEAFERMAGEVRIVPAVKEGIQADYSFHQHGALLYSGGYGKEFAIDCARFAYFANGTRFEFPEKKIELLSAYILDGLQWMVRGGIFDYGAMGRAITEKGENASRLIEACDYMAKLYSPRRAEFIAFAERLQGKDDGFYGNRYFWKSDFMTQRRKDYYTSVRMFSKRLFNTDGPFADEGKKSHHIADGTTFIFRTGKEYVDIFPVWDWKRIPGTTVEQSKEPLRMKDVRVRGRTTFVGGVSDGTYGMAAMDLARGKLTAKKSWFYFDKEFVCLGAGITDPTDNPVLTSINQSLLKGEVVVSDGKSRKIVDRGERVLKSPLWVYQDGVGYVFPGKVNVHLKNEAQTGSWWDINGSYIEDKGVEVSRDVFSLWLDHGKKISGKTYSYIVVPGIALGDLDDYARDDGIEILSNTPQLQAVRHKGLKMLEVVYWKAGKLKVPGGLSVAVDKPCLLMLWERKDGIQLTLSNPENQPLAVNVEINRELKGEGCTWLRDKKISLVRFSLPSGEDAGKSVIRLLRAGPGE